MTAMLLSTYPEIQVHGFLIELPIVVQGLIIGATYGILAVGLVLIYRTNRIINFAHGQMGAFGAAVFGLVVASNGWADWRYWLLLPFALVFSGLVGAGVELAVVRRLRNAPVLMSVVATVGVAAVLLGMQSVVNGTATNGQAFPQPPLPDGLLFTIGRFQVTQTYAATLYLTPVVVAALAAFLRFSRFGQAMRAAAANPDLALLSGIFATRMSTLAWGIAGAISCFTAILLLPTQGFVSVDTFGPSLLLLALTGAVIGRMNNLPISFASGLGIGVLQSLLDRNQLSGGFLDVVLFGVIVVTLLALPPLGSRVREKGSAWARVQGWTPLPAAYRRAFAVRHGAKLGWLLALVVFGLAPLVASFGAVQELSVIFAFAIAALSIGVITGLSGQLSLGQFALAGIGAVVAVEVASRTGDFPLAVLAGGAGGAAASLVVGLPALRIRGLELAVTTLAFALLCRDWLFLQPWMMGSGLQVAKPYVATLDVSETKRYYYFAFFFLVAAVWLARNLWRGGMRRVLVALRDNEDAARSFTVPATMRLIQSFAIAGFLAGLGGAVYAFALATLSYQTFSPSESINLLVMAVIGGIGILAGPLIGVFYVIGIPDFLSSHFDAAALAASSAGWLLLILYVPGGLAGLLDPVRRRAARLLAGWSGVDVAAADAEAATVRTAESAIAVVPALSLGTAAEVVPLGQEQTPILAARSLVKRFGGVTAVAGVSLEVRRGETLGLIGPNGAGKTTLFELLSGFLKPDAGEIEFNGRPLIRRWRLLGRTAAMLSSSPERRGRLGLVRSFQDALLFPTLTVEEAVMLAQERERPTDLLASMFGGREQEQPKRVRARELIANLGLESYRERAIRELSTGTRRVAELCCMLALAPDLLLLDEPSSGIAQRESEALGELLVRIKAHLGTTLVVIEHDIPLVMGIADRVVAMESGRVISVGTPAEVRADPQVVESYLGGDVKAIERSGLATLAPALEVGR